MTGAARARRLAVVAGLVAGLGLATPARAASPSTVAPGLELGRPKALRDVSLEAMLDTQLPLDLEFRDSSGKSVRLADLVHDKPVLLTFAYYDCPMLCTLVLKGLVAALRLLPLEVGRDFDVIVVSIDPREGPELAQRTKDSYVQRYGKENARDGWHFLTGEEPAIRALAEAAGWRYAYDEARGEYAHPAALLVLTPEGRISRYLNGIEYPAQDLRLGLVEASEHRIGTLTDRVLLFCYQYDPATGRYSLLALNLVRAGGVVTVLGIGGFVFVARRREKRESDERC